MTASTADKQTLLILTHNLDIGGVQKNVAALANDQINYRNVIIVLLEDNKAICYRLNPALKIEAIPLLAVDTNAPQAGEQVFAYRLQQLNSLFSHIQADIAISFEDYSNILLMQSVFNGKKVLSCRVSLNHYQNFPQTHLLPPGFYHQNIVRYYPSADAIVCVSQLIAAEIRQLLTRPSDNVRPEPVEGPSVPDFNKYSPDEMPLANALNAGIQVIYTGLDFAGIDPYKELQNLVIPSMVRQAHHERDQIPNVRHGLVEGQFTGHHENLLDQINKPFILNCSRLHPQKGLTVLFKAYAKIANEITHDLVIIGDGPQRDELIELARALGVSGRVHLLGKLNEPYAYLFAADLFVFPSLNEGFSNAVLEAMYCGAGVIASRYAGHEEIFNDYGNLVDINDVEALADKMRDFLTDTPALTALKNRQKLDAYGFDLKKTCAHYQNLFDSLY